MARLAKKNMREGLLTSNANGRLLSPEDCFEAIIADRTQSMILIPKGDVHIDERLLDGAILLACESIAQHERQKRALGGVGE